MRRLVTISFALSFLLLPLGCGDDDDSSPQSPAGSGGAGGGLAGQGGAGQGGASGQGGGAAGTGGGAGGGSSGAAGASGTGGSAGSTGASCQPDKAVVVGSVGATTINEAYLATGGYEMPYFPASNDVVLSVGDAGRAYLAAASPPPEGQPVAVSGILQLPSSDATKSTFVCAGDGSSLTVFGDDGPLYSSHLASLSQLGACPGGTPVAGEITITLGDGSPPPKVVSTVEDAAFNVGVNKVSMLGHDNQAGVVAEVFTQPRQGVAFFSFDEASTATLDPGAYFVMPEGSPDAGAVYCAGAGSTAATTGVGSNVVIESVTLRNLSRLGACPGTAATGALDLCFTPIGG
jgi:hypothetical protein